MYCSYDISDSIKQYINYYIVYYNLNILWYMKLICINLDTTNYKNKKKIKK